MINFRFHLVSLVAAFLALAIGLATGASIVNQGLVRAQKAQLARLETRLNERATQIGDLKTERNRWKAYAEQGEKRIVQGRLVSTPVIFVRMAGVPDGPIQDLMRTVADAGAKMAGELTIEPIVALADDAELTSVRAALDASSERPDTLRFLLRARLRDALLDPDNVPSLSSLERAGFVTFRLRAGGAPADVPTLPTGARVIVVSGGDTKVDPAVSETLLQMIVAQGPRRVVAVEAGPNHPFMRAVRSSDLFKRKLSTVDDIERLEGRMAVVLALDDLERQLVGNYGVDSSAERLLPAAA